MANILYIEDDPTAYKVLDGIIKRSTHELFQAESVEEAWRMLLKSVNYDLIIMEVKLEDETAWPIIKKIKSNPFLATIPIIVYSKIKDKRLVRSVVAMDVQNYLYKPFREQVVHEEIDKATATDWRITLAGNPELFYSRTKVSLGDFRLSNVDLSNRMKAFHDKLKGKSIADMLVSSMKGEFNALAEFAEWQDYTVYSKLLKDILAAAEASNAEKVKKLIAFIPNAVRLQQYRLDYLEAMLGLQDEDVNADVVEVDEEYVPDAEKQKYEQSDIEEKIKEILEYPVIESAAASFQMISDDVEISMGEIVEMIERDSGLAAAVLQFSNSSYIAPASAIEDIHQAISVLGLMRVRLLAMSLRTVSELSSLFSAFRWQDFWMHQVGCAMLSEYIFEQLELPGRSQIAYLAGLLHDLGKLLLCEIDPELYKIAVNDSAEKNLTLAVSESEYFGCDHAQAGLVFAKANNFSGTLQTVIAHHSKIEDVKDDMQFVGCVSLANYLCMRYGIGDSGDRVPSGIEFATAHPSWELFSPWLSPNFSTARFNQDIEIKANRLRIELLGLATQLQGK